MSKKVIETVNTLLVDVNSRGWEIVGILPYKHKDDYYLARCLIRNEKNMWVSYIYNVNSGFHNGNYFESYEEALEDFKNRV